MATSVLRPIAVGNLPVTGDLPYLNRVVVIVRVDAAHGHELGQRRLHIAGLIRTSRGQERFAPIPLPGPSESCVRPWQDGRLEHGGCPALTAVDGDLDLRDRSAAAPGEACHLEQSWTREGVTGGRACDERLGFHVEGELTSRTVG